MHKCDNTGQQTSILYVQTGPDQIKLQNIFFALEASPMALFFCQESIFSSAIINLELHASEPGHKGNTFKISPIRFARDFNSEGSSLQPSQLFHCETLH